jgi:DNA-binding IclR family transcriptional regulator
VGKAILAFLPEHEAEQLLGPAALQPFTANTITERRALFEHLAGIRRDGYAVSSEEVDVGVLGVGVPLLNWAGRPVGAISVTGPLLRLDDARLQEVIPVLREAAAEWRRTTQGSPAYGGSIHSADRYGGVHHE